MKQMYLQDKEVSKSEVFGVLAKMVLSAIAVWNKPIELDENKQPKITQKEKATINEK